MVHNHPIYRPLYTDTEHFIILITGGRGCERPSQEVIMADMSVKQIKGIKEGDLVMGDDFTPRRVLGTLAGRSMMYRVKQTSADDYFVNDAHIISVRKSKSAMEDKGELTKNGTYRRPKGRYPQYEEFTDMNVLAYANSSKHFRENFRGYKAGSIPYKESEVAIEPYMLGVWLGDGTAIFPNVTNCDEEVIQYLYEYAERIGCRVAVYEKQKTECKGYGIRSHDGKNNPFLNNLRAYGLIGNKHIPQEYISNSERVRLELLAGILDTDGTMYANGYEVTQKSEVLARQIKFVADSLGFRTSISEKRAYIGGKDCGVYYRIHINGDTWRIPCKVKRKIVTEDMCHKNKDWRLSYLSVEEDGVGDWCGIILDGNQRYLHSDGTVTHNSGKSFAAATFIERLTFEMKKRNIPSGEQEKIVHNILFSRYTMTSAGISVIPEFMEKIEKDGTEDYFHATKTDVVNNLTGARVMFRGIKTSSGNQTAKLKSIHGITTFVCDEAEEWQSEDDFNTIMLSIRQKGIQNRVIIIMNPTDKNHFVYDKYIKDTHRIEYFDGVPVQISTHPNVLHIHTTYLDNIANLSDEFVKEAQYNKENKPKVYAHTFMGRWTDEVEGRVFNNYEYCDEFPEGAKHLGIGLDFGYSSDPTAIVRCGLVGNDLYIDELCYKTHMLSSDIIKELQPYSYNNGYGNALPVIADSADPRLIQEIANGGILIYPVNKSGGSINAGIDKMQTFDHIYITRRSRNAKMEFDNYTWDKDKDGNYINVPIDAYNHCFTGDTIVLTGFGGCRIDGLREGMLVETSQGFRKVTRFFDNGCKPAVKATLKYEHGEVVVTATPDHKIKTTNGWIELKDLKQGMEIFLAKSLTAKSTTNTKASGTIQEAQKECTLQYGNTTMAMCRKVTMYTIKMRIPRTTKYQTSNYCQPLNTCQTTQRNGLKRVVNLNECERIWTKPERLQANGMEVMRAGLGTHYTQSNRYEKNMRKCAKSAEVSTSHFIQALAGFAPTNARLHGEDTKGLTTRCEFASIAEKSLLYPSTSRKTTAKSATILSSQMVQGEQAQSGNGTMTARLLDVSITDAGVQHVYDIEVEEMHEFFANGVLVHNCIDATRYYTLGKLLGRILQPRRVDVNNLGIF